MSAVECWASTSDGFGSQARIEADPRDGREYLTVRFEGVDAPFVLTANNARFLAGMLSLVAERLKARETGHGGRETGLPGGVS